MRSVTSAGQNISSSQKVEPVNSKIIEVGLGQKPFRCAVVEGDTSDDNFYVNSESFRSERMSNERSFSTT